MIEHFKFPNQFIDDQFVPYIEKEDIKLLIKSLAYSISEKYKDQELIVIGVLKGSSCFTASLVREIVGVDLYIDFIKLSSVGRTESKDGTILIQKDTKMDLRDRNVLIVEDIVDSGRALKFIQDRIMLCKPASLETITLFDKPYKRKTQVQVDYIGKKIEERFIVGFGLDLEDYGRNLNDVYYLKYPN